MIISKVEYSVILFDGICNLCNSTINFLINTDKGKKFRYAPLQSETAQEIIKQYNLREPRSDSIILIKEGQVYMKSSAVIEIVKDLPGLWRYLASLKYFPRFLRDMVYDFIAENRYNLFGRRNECMIPSEGVKDLFLP